MTPEQQAQKVREQQEQLQQALNTMAGLGLEVRMTNKDPEEVSGSHFVPTLIEVKVNGKWEEVKKHMTPISSPDDYIADQERIIAEEEASIAKAEEVLRAKKDKIAAEKTRVSAMKGKVKK